MSATNQRDDAGDGRKTPNATLRQDITRDDLPLHCPMEGMSLWNSHPRVYIPIEKTGKALCPYCGTFYVLKDD
jgi:uncharacterized Zn-finger protein